MRIVGLTTLGLWGLVACMSESAPKTSPKSTAAEERPIALVIHGGAGAIAKDKMSPALEAQYRQTLAEVTAAGYAVLAKGGTSLDAVEAAIVLMEDSPLFNAGKGSVMTHDDTVEMDASVMDGATGNAGAVAGVQTLRNPIRAARRVMTHSQHQVVVTAVGF